MADNVQVSCPPSLLGTARVTIPATTADYSAVSVSELIRACVEGEAAAWQEFIERFHRIIAITSYRAARRWGKDSPAVVDDLTQEAYVKLCADHARVLREFDSPHPDAMFAFLKVVTAGEKPLTVYRHVTSGSSFGANPLEQLVGLAKADRIVQIPATLALGAPRSSPFI